MFLDKKLVTKRRAEVENILNKIYRGLLRLYKRWMLILVEQK